MFPCRVRGLLELGGAYWASSRYTPSIDYSLLARVNITDPTLRRDCGLILTEESVTIIGDQSLVDGRPLYRSQSDAYSTPAVTIGVTVTTSLC